MALKLPTLPQLQTPTAGGLGASNAFALATGQAPIANTPQMTPYVAPVVSPAITPVPVQAPVAPVTAISASKLTPQPTPVYPVVQPNLGPQTTLQSSLAALQQQALGIQAEIQKQNEATTGNTSSTGNTTTPTTTSRASILDRILGFQDDIAGKGEYTQDANKDAGVNEKAAEVTRLTNEYTAREQYYNDEIKKIQKTNAKGTGAEVAAAQIQQLTQQKNEELANISISSAAAQGNYKLAQDIAKQAVDAKFSPIQEQVDLLKTYYQLSADDLTESEKLTAQEKIQEKQAKVDFDRQKEMADYKAKIEREDPLYRANLANVYSQIAERRSGVSSQGQDPDVVAYTQALQNGSATLAQIPQKLRGMVLQSVQATGTNKLLGLLDQYKNTVKDLNFFTANLPGNRALLDTMKGQITAVYKQQQQLGTLDNGVQTLVDRIIPDPSKLSVSSLSNKAQIAAIDNFISNQGGNATSLPVLSNIGVTTDGSIKSGTVNGIGFKVLP